METGEKNEEDTKKDAATIRQEATRLGSGARTLTKGAWDQKRRAGRAGAGAAPTIAVLETGGGGDCLFHALAFVVRAWSGLQVDMHQLRRELAVAVRRAGADKFIADVKRDHKDYLPAGGLDFNKHPWPDQPRQRLLALREVLLTPGQRFQGTDVCLQYLVTYSNFFRRGAGVLTLTSHGPGFSSVLPDPHANPRRFYLVLYCYANAHFKAAAIDGLCVITHAQLLRLLPHL